MLCDTTAASVSAIASSSTSEQVDPDTNARTASLEGSMSFNETITFAPKEEHECGKAWSRLAITYS